jgi:hypothetical protein
MSSEVQAVAPVQGVFKYYLGGLLCLASASLLLSSGLFESDFIGALLLFSFSSGLAFLVDRSKSYEGRYFVAASASQLLGIVFVFLFWIVPLGFDYFSVNEGFDPARFDYLARNSGEWDYIDLGLPGAVVVIINAIYGAFGFNIFVNGISLYFLLSLFIFSIDRDVDFAVALPVSLIVFPDLLLLFNLPAKEGYAFLAILSWYAIAFKSGSVGWPGKLTLVFILLYCCIPRPHLLGALVVSFVAYRIACGRPREFAMMMVSIVLLASFFYFLQGDRLETISEYSAVTKEGENTESIDGTKGAVRDFFATDPRSLTHLLLTPVRFLAYILAPFPTGGVLQATSYNYEIGPSGYAPFIAMMSRVSFYSIIALLTVMVLNWARIRASSLMLVGMFISGLVFASLYSPFLHQRYRIPFLPLLYLAARMNGLRYGGVLVWVIVASEVLSALLFLAQAYLAGA